MTYYFTPYSTTRNLGASYNRYMSLLSDSDHGCLQDGDSMMCIPNWGHVIDLYVRHYPNDVLICWVNRLHDLAVAQRFTVAPVEEVEDCIRIAISLRDRFALHPTLPPRATQVTGSVSGTLMVIPQHIWAEHPFAESNKYRPGEPPLLGIDNEWTNRIRAAGVRIMRMDGLIIYHQYRLLSGGKDKSHLL